MHPEIVQDHPGACPKCGMTLEPKAIGGEEHEHGETRSLSRKFWIALVLTIPVLVLAMGHAIPRLDAARKARLHPIEGAPRDMLRPPAACPFQPRCRYEVEASSQEVPPLEEIERGHKVACFNPVPEDEWQNMRNQVVAP